MTDSNDPTRRSRRRRSGPSRVPPTIDLKATEVESRAADEPAETQPSATVDTPGPAAGTPAEERTSASDTSRGPEDRPPSPADLTAQDPTAGDPMASALGRPLSPADSPPAQDPTAGDPMASALGRPPESTVEGGSASPSPDATASPAWDPEPREGAAHAAEESDRDSLQVATPDPASATVDPLIQGPRDDPARRGPGLGTMAATGLVGGLVGAGLLYGLQAWRSTQEPSDPRVDRIEQQVGTLARRDDFRGLEGRLAALEGTQSGLSQRVEAARTLAERSAARAEEAAGRSAPAASPQNDAALTDLSNRVNAVETQVRDGLQAAAGPLQALERRVAEQEQRLAAASQPLERRLGEVEQRLAAVAQPLEQRLGQVEQRLATATEPLERRFAEQEQRLAALTRQVAEGGSEVTRAGTRTVLADRLGDALRDGAPYPEVLAGLKRFTPDAAKLAPLEPFAATGAPSAPALAQEFKPIAERLRREARQGAEDWTDRLLRMADKVVTVRAVNEPAEAGVPGTVARIEDALASGAFGEAAAAFEALPEPARQAAGPWGQKLRQRAAAEAAARAVAADAVAALNQATR